MIKAFCPQSTVSLTAMYSITQIIYYFLRPKKVAFDFFTFRRIRIWEKALDFFNLVGKFGLNYFPGF